MLERDADDAFIVHAPASWSKLRKLLASPAVQRPGFVARYKAKCSGRKVELPPNVALRSDEDGDYFAAGPHERYYRRCEACLQGSGS